MFTFLSMTELHKSLKSTIVTTPIFLFTELIVAIESFNRICNQIDYTVFTETHSCSWLYRFLKINLYLNPSATKGVYSCRKNPYNQNNKQLRSWIVTASLE